MVENDREKGTIIFTGGTGNLGALQVAVAAMQEKLEQRQDE